ncbi:MAG: hypothetical protein HUU54_07440 [Ignavibacteriaceae bacterium]|nr:hypothetical protein [Ignavibacteriaceae bacterium]
MKEAILIVVILLSADLMPQTQNEGNDTTMNSATNIIKDAVTSSIKISGDAGTYGEFYTISGKANRRPPTTGRIFFRPSITLFDNFSISFDIFLSTEGNAARQQISTLSLHPTWGWSKWHIGDFSADMSKFTLSGLNIRGGGVELNPGWIRFAAYGGQSQRATNTGAFTSTYARNVVAGKIGFGSETNFIDFNVVKVKDDLNSLPRDIFTRIDTTVVDTLTKIDTTYTGVTAQENLVIGTTTAFRLFNGIFSFRGEAAGSIFTKDLLSDAVDSKDLPEGMDKIYKPRMSTSADYAYTADMNLNFRVVTMRLGYSEIGPGYTSLGLPSVINDKRSLNTGIGFNLFDGLFSIQGTYQAQNNNLGKQKLNTTNRNAYGISASITPVRDINISLNTSYNTLVNDAKNDTLKIDNSNISFSSTVSFQLNLFGLRHNVSTTYGNQLYQDANILRKGSDVTSHNMNISLSTTFNPQWSASVSSSYNLVQIQDRGDNSTSTLSMRAMNRSFNNKLNSSASYSLTNSQASIVHAINMQTSYPVMANGSISASMRVSLFVGKGANASSFRETTGNINYGYRF